jgi:hypothetical protein
MYVYFKECFLKTHSRFWNPYNNNNNNNNNNYYYYNYHRYNYHRHRNSLPTWRLVTARICSRGQLTEAEAARKAELMEEGFPDWTRKDFRCFCAALEQYGRKDRESVFRQVSHETGKPEGDVAAYFEAFLQKAETSLTEWAKIVEKIEKGEKKIQRQMEIKEALNQKVCRPPRLPPPPPAPISSSIHLLSPPMPILFFSHTFYAVKTKNMD